MEPFTLTTAAKFLSDETSAWKYMEKVRWQGRPICPHCHSLEVRYLAPKEGPRTTRSGKISHRRVWRCSACRKQFSVLVGTIFEGSKIPVGKWLMALYLMSAAKNGISAHELHRDLQITYKTAWFMAHRIREAMLISPAAEKLSGVIVADETWVGGDPKNRHSVVPTTDPVKMVPGEQRPNQHTDKAPVLSLVNPDTGEVRSTTIGSVTSPVLRKFIADNVDMGGSILYTDEGSWYGPIGREFSAHKTVNHSIGQYSNNGASTNRAEGFFAQFKRSVDGTHHYVTKEHLSRYVGEFDFRFSTCKMSDGERATTTITRSGGRYISYRTLASRGPVARGTRQMPPGRPGPRPGGQQGLPRALGDAG